jgi:hypothetical protein
MVGLKITANFVIAAINIPQALKYGWLVECL